MALTIHEDEKQPCKVAVQSSTPHAPLVLMLDLDDTEAHEAEIQSWIKFVYGLFSVNEFLLSNFNDSEAFCERLLNPVSLLSVTAHAVYHREFAIGPHVIFYFFTQGQPCVDSDFWSPPQQCDGFFWQQIAPGYVEMGFPMGSAGERVKKGQVI